MSAPTHNLWRRWASNSMANLIGGVAGAGVSVLLPSIVAKHLDTASFSVWNLALQVVVYVNLLSLGLQTATARALAHAADAGAGIGEMPVIVRAARSISHGASAIALGLVALLVAAYPLLFPGVSDALVGDFRWTLMLFGLGAVAQILAQVEMGVFQGLHRNAEFVMVNVAMKLLTVALVWVGVKAHQPMAVLALLMAGTTALLWPAMRAKVGRNVAWAKDIGRSALDRAVRLDLLKYCGTLSVWSLMTMLVNSVGIVIVGRIDFVVAGAYAVAMTAANVVVGLLGAALAPLMTSAAALNASEATRPRLQGLLTRATLGVAIGLNLFLAAVTWLAPELLRAWVGESYVRSAAPLMVVLVGAHCLRNIGAPYALMLLGTGLHTRALTSAILEGAANVATSVVLGMKWGAIGVACGTLVGAIVGVVGSLWLNTSRTPELTPRPLYFSLVAVALPNVLFAPLHFYLLQRIF
jgi:O-antigen/teichoic acid export membrane protein